MRDRDSAGLDGRDGRRDRQLLGTRCRQVRALQTGDKAGERDRGASAARLLHQSGMQDHRHAAGEQIRALRVRSRPGLVRSSAASGQDAASSRLWRIRRRRRDHQARV